MAEIGETLREARMRRRIDMTEVETATKIRGKYLRALENEEWDLLPGPTFVKSFLRTYAEYLGLDSRLLVEEYRQRFERPATQDLTPFSAGRNLGRTGRRRRARLAAIQPVIVIGVGVIALLAVFWVLGKLGPDEETPPAANRVQERTPTPTPDGGSATNGNEESPARRPRRVRLRLVATGPVYVCLVDAPRQAGDRRADAGGRDPHPHVHQPLVQDQLRQRQRDHARQREDVSGGRERRPGRLRAEARQTPAEAVGRAAAGLLVVSVRAGIVVTGTEVLSGIIRDANGPWLSERLRELGVTLAHVMVVGDRPDDLRAALDFLQREQMDLVITTGGLGPTADDLTAEVVAGFAGLEVELDEALEGRIWKIISELRGRWRDIDEASLRAGNRKQALVPRGAVVMEPIGTAPGLVVAGAPIVVVAARAAARAAADVGGGPGDRAGAGGALACRLAGAADHAPDRAPGVGDRPDAARRRGGRRSARPP